ncbi:MAG: helix-turn-helix transcriptional regulator [Polyangiaceae bacterium]|nr:helix-turn-helix transcriptional regulator [Polyangiaceae bacterium]
MFFLDLAGTWCTSDTSGLASVGERLARFPRPVALLVDLRHASGVPLRQLCTFLSGIGSDASRPQTAPCADPRRSEPVCAIALVLAARADALSVLDACVSGARLFSCRSDAAAWLAQRVEEAGATCSLVRDSEPRRSVTLRVRDHLQRAMPDVSLDSAARAIGLSRRSVQRHLRIEGTSFRGVLGEVRLDRAQELLAFTDMHVAIVSKSVGLQKSDHLRVLLRQAAGMTPAEWRDAAAPLRSVV